MKTQACYKKLRKYKYQLVKEFVHVITITQHDINLPFIKLTNEGKLIVTKGYAWDGASGPTIDTLNSMRASLVHDALYQLLRLEELDQKYVKRADVIFRDMLIDDGMFTPRALLWYRMLRVFNGKHAKPGIQENDNFCVPV